MSAISIRAKILAITLAFLLLLSAIFIVYSAFATENYKRLRLEGIAKTVEYETEKVNKTIAEIESGAIHFAIVGLLSRRLQALEVGELSAIEYLGASGVAEGGGFWFEPFAYDGKTRRIGIYAHYDESTGGYTLDKTMYIDGVLNVDEYDYHGMSWYREIVDAVTRPHEVKWTRPYIDDSGSRSLMTTAGAGMYNEDGELVGASIIDWKIKDIVEELSAIKPTENSFVLLCAPAQDYVITNTHSGRDAALDSSGAGMDSIAWDTGAETFELDGVEYMSFGRVMENEWSLTVCIPSAEIFEEMESRNDRFVLTIALCAAGMMCIVFFLISALVNKPMKRLIDGVSQLRLGNLDVGINVDTRDELGLFARAFKKMASDLKASIDHSARVMAEKERIGAELNVATKIQASMLPCIFPAFPDRAEFDIYAGMEPAEEVGGDFYDFYFIDEETLAFVIADVSDKGIPAALFMVIAKTLIKNNAQSGKSPKEVFEAVNNILFESNEAEMFVTAFLGYLNVSDGTLRFVNAGHNPPLLRRGGRFDWLKTKPEFVLAVIEDSRYTQHEIVLSPGDELFLYTDGVTEAANKEYGLFGEARLLETVNGNLGLPLKEFLAAVHEEVDIFADGAAQADDITMLHLRYLKKAEPSGILRIEAKAENLEDVLRFVGEKISGFPPQTQNRVILAVDEIFTNISRYAYSPGTGDVAIKVSAGDGICVEFVDEGVEYDPLTAEAPDMGLPASEREPGGLGVYIVKGVMDSLEYSRENGKNIVRIKKQ